MYVSMMLRLNEDWERLVCCVVFTCISRKNKWSGFHHEVFWWQNRWKNSSLSCWWDDTAGGGGQPFPFLKKYFLLFFLSYPFFSFPFLLYCLLLFTFSQLSHELRTERQGERAAGEWLVFVWLEREQELVFLPRFFVQVLSSSLISSVFFRSLEETSGGWKRQRGRDKE